MAGSVNRVILIGRVGSDPDYHKFPNGGEMIDFSLATSESWRDQQSGERKEKTQWHKVKVTGEGLVKVVKDFVRKGSLVNVIGMIEYETWEKDGEKKYATKIAVKPIGGSLNLLESKGDGEARGGGGERRDDRRQDYGAQRGGSAPSQGARPGTGSTGFSRDLDDDIPFAPEWRG